MDEQWEAEDEDWEEPLVEDMPDGPPMDPADEIVEDGWDEPLLVDLPADTDEDENGVHGGVDGCVRLPTARGPKRRRKGDRDLPPLPLCMGSFFATPCCQGAREGYVFTTARGATGYYREEGRHRQSLDANFPELGYLAGVLGSGGKVTINLEELLPQPTDPRRPPREDWQDGQKRATRSGMPRAKRKPCRPPPTAEVDQEFGTRTECQTEDSAFRGHGLIAIDTVNPNASPAALEYLERSAADAIVVQELRTIGPRTLAVQRAAKWAGWHLSSQHADATEKDGVSAGVGVAVRARLGLAVSPCRAPRNIAVSLPLALGWGLGIGRIPPGLCLPQVQRGGVGGEPGLPPAGGGRPPTSSRPMADRRRLQHVTRGLDEDRMALAGAGGHLSTACGDVRRQ